MQARCLGKILHQEAQINMDGAKIARCVIGVIARASNENEAVGSETERCMGLRV